MQLDLLAKALLEALHITSKHMHLQTKSWTTKSNRLDMAKDGNDIDHVKYAT